MPTTGTDLRLGPRSIERPTDAGATAVAPLDAPIPALVDGGGLVTPPGRTWSIDWWVGGDDRWYLPSREPSIRQRRLGYGPVIETSVRIPSGDAVSTVYPVMTGSGSATVIEVRNDSPVPVALALAIRPYDHFGGPAPDGILVEAAGDRLLVAGEAAVVLPRAPASFGFSVETDLVQVLEVGGDLTGTGSAGPGHELGPGPGHEPDPAGPGSGRGNAVALYPLPHKTSLRFAVPTPSPVRGRGRRVEAAGVIDPRALPDADTAARGWTTIVEQGGRFEFPDPGLTELTGAARARLLLASSTLPERVVDLRPGAGRTLEALALGGHRSETGRVLDELARSFPAKLDHGPGAGAEVLVGLAAAVGLSGEADRGDDLLEIAAQLMHLVERSGDGDAATAAAGALAGLLRSVDQPDPARGLIERFGPRHLPGPDPAAVTAMAGDAAPAGRWPRRSTPGSTGPGYSGFGDSGFGDDDLAAAEFWVGARHLMLTTDDSVGTGQVRLFPVFPTAWRGGSAEVHRAPTPWGLCSFAVRWHGHRPALLWDFEPWEHLPHRSAIPELTCPGLDPGWSTTEPKGETLLVGQAAELPPAPGPGDSFA